MTDYERVMVNMNQQDIATTNGNGTTVNTNTNTTEENTNKGMNANNTSTFENNSTNNTPNNSEDNTTTITTNSNNNNNNNNNNKNNKITPLTPDASNDNDQKMLMDSSAYQKENENIYTSVANRNNIGITDEKDNNNITDHNNDTSIDINNDINNNINNNDKNNNNNNNNNNDNTNNNNENNSNNNDNENRNDNNDITNNNEQDHNNNNNNNNNNKDKDNKDQENNESVGEDSELEPLQQATLEEQEAARQENTTTTGTIKSEVNTNEPLSTSGETNVSVDADASADANATASADPNANADANANTTADVVTAAQPPPPDLTPSKDPLPDHQHKYATTSIRNIKRLKDARPFLVPVDPVALNIPQYFQYITKPVDLSLIEKKLQLKVYSNVEEFYSDFKLMVDNCVRFNGETSGIAIMAKNLFQAFEKHMNNMPSRDLPKKNTASNTSSTSGSGGGGGGSSSSSSNTTTSSANQSRSGKSFTNGTSGVESAKAATATSAAPASKRPKRQIHPPKTKDLYYNEISKTNAKPKDKNILQDLNFAKNVVKDLMSKKYININFAFLEPVDPVALNLPTYFDYVKNPMDLGTISKKLANWEYKNLEQVQSDIELVFNNCFAFNPVGTPVNDLGVKLKAIYEKEWMKRPEPLPPTPEPAHQGSGYYYGNDNEDGQYADNGYGEYDDDSNGEYSDEEIDEASVTTPAIQFMEQQLVQIQQELKKLRKIEIDKIKNDRRQAKRSMKQKMVKRKGNNGRTNGLKRKRGGAVGMSSGPGNHKRSKSQQLEVVATYEMKKYMAEKLEHLTPNELDNISTFVQANIDLESLPKDEAGEWVFDLNHFPNDLVVTLYNTFFKKYTDFHNGNGVAATPVSSFVGNSAGLNNHLTVGTPVAYGSSVSTPADHHVFYPHANGANATIMGQPVSGNSISPITNPALLNASGRKKSRSDEAEKISQIKQKLEMLNATASPGQSLGTPTSISNLSKGSVPSLHGSDSQSGESDDDMSSDESEEE